MAGTTSPALYPTLRHIDRILARWAHRKFQVLEAASATITAMAGAHRAPPAGICSLTGVFCRDAAEQWEPDEARVFTSVSARAWG